MYCSKCGAKNEDSSQFCYSCGNSLAVPENLINRMPAAAQNTANAPNMPNAY